MSTQLGSLGGNTSIIGLPDLSVGDFWCWAYSDLLSNANRGVFAEFVVGAALGALGAGRVEWDAVDLRYRGAGVEVKTSGECQTWEQSRPSAIRFGISQTLGWDAVTNTYSSTPRRNADIYVFCHHAERDKLKANPLDLGQWVFYVVATSTLDATFAGAKTISLARLRTLAVPYNLSELKGGVDRTLDCPPAV